MAETFDGIFIMVKINETWIDLSADVLSSPAPRVNGMGIMEDGPLDRVGSSARFTFSLNNSQENSAGVLGYYTPGMPGGLAGWTTGLYVRLYFVYDGVYKGAFYGKINPDGITITPGYQGRRDVRVECSNWMREAENQTVDLIEYQTNLTADEALLLVISNMPNAPLATSFQVGTRTFPTVFDITSKKTKSISEINKLTLSEFGYFYLRGDHAPTEYVGGETAVFEKRTHRYDQRESVSAIQLHSSESLNYLLLENGDNLLLETGDLALLEASQDAEFSEADIRAMSVKYGKHIYNRAKLTAYPRLVDVSPVVLWELEEPLEIAANGSLTGIRGSYRDPNGKSASVSGINMVTPPESGTDYIANSQADGLGSNLTSSLSVSVVYGTSEAEYTLTNTGGTTLFVTTLQARGYGVYVFDTASVQYDNVPSIRRYGVSEITLDMPYISDVTNLFTFSNNYDRFLLENGSYALHENSDYIQLDDAEGIFDQLLLAYPDFHIDRVMLTANRDKFNMMAFMCLDAGSFIRISETMSNISTQYSYVVNGWDLEIKGGGIVEWSMSLLSTLQCPKV